MFACRRNIKQLLKREGVSSLDALCILLNSIKSRQGRRCKSSPYTILKNRMRNIETERKRNSIRSEAIAPVANEASTVSLSGASPSSNAPPDSDDDDVIIIEKHIPVIDLCDT